MHYVITGHSGFIGSEVIRLLDLEKTKYSLITREDNQPKLPFVDPNEEVVLIHLAGLAHREANYDELYQANVNYLEKTINEVLSGCNLKRVIFLSSVAVYGVHESDKIMDESCPLYSDEAYGKVKIFAENKIIELSQRYKFDYVILRPPLVYGRNSPGNLSKLKKWGERLHFLPFGLAKSKRTMIHVSDLSRAIIVSASYPLTISMKFNVCEDKGISTKSLMKRLQLKNYVSVPIPIIIMKLILEMCGKKKLYQQLYGQRLFSNRLIVDETGWKPKFTAIENLEI
ncbi:NAD-dependent epimerase/dehydratase family protein [Alphaproteobacteria bacterium LSUCC0396]